MFSGDKLIDNENYRDQLLKIDPEAIGGEMEGSGIFHACEESGTDWIVVKAICDFADGNKGKNKDANQKIANTNFILPIESKPVKSVSNSMGWLNSTPNGIWFSPAQRGQLYAALSLQLVVWFPAGAADGNVFYR